MRKHEGYEELKDETSSNETVKIPQAPKAQEVLKKRGRPRKEVMEI